MNRLLLGTCVVSALCMSLRGGARADVLYVANSNNQTVDQVSPAGNASVLVADPGNLTVLCDPVGLAFNSAGDLFVANSGSSSIEEITPQGGVSTFATLGLMLFPRSLAFDSSGNLFVTSDTKILKYTPAGVGTVFVPPGHGVPVALAFDKNGNLFFSGDVAPAQEGVLKVTPSGAVSVFINTGFNQFSAMAFDSAGNLYGATPGDLDGPPADLVNTIEKVTPGGAISVFASTGLSDPEGLAFDSSGNLYVANANNDSVGNSIERFAPDGTGSVFATGLSEPMGLAVRVPECASWRVWGFLSVGLLVVKTRRLKAHSG
jgi:DNA-binding beta-propeller fold protein YncE